MAITLNQLYDVEWKMQIFPHEFVTANKILIYKPLCPPYLRIPKIYLFFKERQIFNIDIYLLELDLQEKLLSLGFSRNAARGIKKSNIDVKSKFYCNDRIGAALKNLGSFYASQSFEINESHYPDSVIVGIDVFCGQKIVKEISDPYAMWALSNVGSIE